MICICTDDIPVVLGDHGRGGEGGRVAELTLRPRDAQYESCVMDVV